MDAGTLVIFSLQGGQGGQRAGRRSVNTHIASPAGYITTTLTTKHFTCPTCYANTVVPTHATDRVDLERERGESFPATCKHCLKPRAIHVNDVRAVPNRVITGIGVFAGVVALGLLWQMGFIAWIAGGLPVVVYRAQVASASAFNGYSLPRAKK